MTEDKDFKRIVRTRARRTGQSYSTALRHVRGGTPALNEERLPMAITRTIPDVRSTNIEKTTRYYTELLGFDTRVEHGEVVAFVSATHDGVEVTLNRDGFALPPGFTVEVGSVDAVRALHERSRDAGLRIVEELSADGTQFSVLDPSGRRITLSTPGVGARMAASGDGDASRAIKRAIPGVTTQDIDATRRFYIEHLGFVPGWDVDGIMLFRSPTAPRAQVIASTRVAHPDGFDLDVGSLERLDRIYDAAQGRSIVLHAPRDFPEHGIRCFMLLDPNGIGVNVVALLRS
jgi:catechol 2,3-dioxygenase-like lactoylglutathione lyase family enzyme